MHTLLSRFVKASAMKSKALEEIEYKWGLVWGNNIKDDHDLLIGQAAREFLASKEENHLRDVKIAEFFRVCATISSV